jgi:hypothetical protein
VDSRVLQVPLSAAREEGAVTRRLLLIVPFAGVLLVRAALAFSTHHVLDWDETYYLSLAVTGARGGGLYPYIYGFGPMAIMGGMGYATYSFVLAVKLFGPTIFALRAVSLLAAVAGLGGLWVLVRMWYGSAAAWIAIAATASLRLFALSNSARMDAWTFAYVAWALVAFAAAFRQPERRWPHAAAGLLFGLGLTVHIDAIATGLACGLVYLVRQPRRAGFFAIGAAAGIGIYAAVSILPDPASYYVMTVLVRADATGTYAGGHEGVLASFLNPRVLLAKEVLRYRQLWTLTTPLEIVLLAAAYVAMFVRRTAADALVIPLTVGVVVAAAVVLNNASPLYYIHVLPALVVPIAPLFTSPGYSAGGTLSLERMPRAAFFAAAVVVWVLCASTSVRTLKTIHALRALPEGPTEFVDRVHESVDRQCRAAGDGTLYVPHFADYPYFVSLQPTEVKHGMLYYRTGDEASYWETVRPDAVFSAEPLRPPLSTYVARHAFEARGEGVWVNPAGCR